MKKQYIEDRLNGIKGSSRRGRIGEKENINPFSSPTAGVAS